EAWSRYDALHADEAEQKTASLDEAPSRSILRSLNVAAFELGQLEHWPALEHEEPHGTALLISEISFDLSAQLDADGGGASGREARDRLRQTLSNFVDPFGRGSGSSSGHDPDFSYSASVWRDGREQVLVGTNSLSRGMVEPLEHQVEGQIAEDGSFHGRIKAFGKWLPEEILIQRPPDVILPREASSRVGPIEIYMATMEFSMANTSHTREEFERFRGMAEQTAGFLIFRDGLRVLPYGRPDNDFFEIESRRTRNAGREFWNHRRMFGRIAISRSANPNLRDKAGREGLIDNRAAKTLKGLVENILIETARRYFGSASEHRQQVLAPIREENAKEKAERERTKLQKAQRAQFRNALDERSVQARALLADMHSLREWTRISTEREANDALAALDEIDERMSELTLPSPPKPLGTLERKFEAFQRDRREIQAVFEHRRARIDSALEHWESERPRQILEATIDRAARRIGRRIDDWNKRIVELQRKEFDRIKSLLAERGPVFPEEVKPILLRFDRAEIDLREARRLVGSKLEEISRDNEEVFEPYIAALQSLQESIDIQRLAFAGMEEAGEMRNELDRLNALAQLGIAVEIVGHELEALDNIIGSGLRRLPPEVRDSRAAKDIEFGYEGLTDQLRFLSPLKLTGNKVQEWVTGEEIADYVSEFFKLPLARQGITIEADAAFKKMKIFEYRPRIYPVFVNLINNSIYWLRVGEESNPRIRLSASNEAVFVSDNGPGVPAADIANLFTLFFTRKIRGGRGVGLYLCRANLAAGGHRISYVGDSGSETDLLSGANFRIEFRGGVNGEG
ncbi:MAG: ATP-binding protein, partial [Allosphingosinicella sp.]|uniref:ATP-binding protein n=1 Tax=Allosphingosinicella sp. TaxID=2823234 RepID=UPI0039260A36